MTARYTFCLSNQFMGAGRGYVGKQQKMDTPRDEVKAETSPVNQSGYASHSPPAENQSPCMHAVK